MSPYRASIVRLLLLTIIAVLPIASPGAAQTAVLPSGTIPILDSTQIRSLRAALQSKKWGEAQALYFGTSYRRDLPDVIVYLDGAHVSQALVVEGRDLKNRILRDKQFLYVLVLSDGGVRWTGPRTVGVGGCAIGGSPDRWAPAVRVHRHINESNPSTDPELTDSVTIVRRGSETRTVQVHDSAAPYAGTPRLIYRRSIVAESLIASPVAVHIRRTLIAHKTDPFIIRFLTGVGGKLFGGASAKDGDAPPRDSTAIVPLVPLGTAGDSTLCHGSAKFPLHPNTDDRIAVEVSNGYELLTGRRTVVNFVSASPSRFTVGLSLGATTGRLRKASVDTTDRFEITTTDSSGTTITRDSVVASRTVTRRGVNARVNGFVLIGVALRRPALPRHPIGVDAVFGTNLPTGGIFDEWIVGLAVTRVFGDVGLVGGCNWLLEDTRARGPTRRCHPYFGLDFRL